MLAHQYVIENVLMSRLRGKVVYLSSFPAAMSRQILVVKTFDSPNGKGYQRPVDRKRSDNFSKYLSNGEDSLFTPILLNAGSKWEFVSYDRQRPNFGRLLCKEKGSLMDGQHRIDGIEKYIQQTNSDITVPFMAFHYLDEDEEIKLFDTINTKAKTIGTSLSKYLRRDSDDISWVATEMVIRKESPFYDIGSIVGKRTKGRHVTLQNLYRIIKLLTADSRISSCSKEEKLNIAIRYFSAVKESFSEQWSDYKGHRLSHIVCLDALAMAGNNVLITCLQDNLTLIDYRGVFKRLNKLKGIDWSTAGPLKYLKGINGSKSLAQDLNTLMIPESENPQL